MYWRCLPVILLSLWFILVIGGGCKVGQDAPVLEVDDIEPKDMHVEYDRQESCELFPPGHTHRLMNAYGKCSTTVHLHPDDTTLADRFFTYDSLLAYKKEHYDSAHTMYLLSILDQAPRHPSIDSAIAITYYPLGDPLKGGSIIFRGYIQGTYGGPPFNLTDFALQEILPIKL